MSSLHNPIPTYLDDYLYPILGKRMLELGRKKTKIEDEWVTYKEWFRYHGIDHTSIDIQGGYDSLPMDLNEEIDLPPFDTVTNIGTTEHVTNQQSAWKNIHNLTKEGGYIISVTPSPGDWWWHGYWYPTLEFYQQLAECNDYIIEREGILLERPRRNVAVRMVKQSHTEFTMPPLDLFYKNTKRAR